MLDTRRQQTRSAEASPRRPLSVARRSGSPRLFGSGVFDVSRVPDQTAAEAIRVEGNDIVFAVDDLDLFGLPRNREVKGGIVVLAGDLALLSLRVELCVRYGVPLVTMTLRIGEK